MAHSQPRPEFENLQNPFEGFRVRNDTIHLAEDRGRLVTSQQISSLEVIEKFINHDNDPLDRGLSGQYQAVTNYLKEAATKGRVSGRLVSNDITESSSDRDICLLDDRHRHASCPALHGHPCTECNIFSEKISIPQLYERLKEGRIAHKRERRIHFFPNITPAGALVLAATIARRSATPLRRFLESYLRRRPGFSILASWGFFLEFHLPYYTKRDGLPRQDFRGLRTYEELPLVIYSQDQRPVYFYEAQTSSLSMGPDEHFWTEYFLVDTYFGGEEGLHDYLQADGKGFDPPLGGVDRRLLQVRKEFKALFDAFDERIRNYEKALATVFADDETNSHMKQLGHALDKIELFETCLSDILREWEFFWGTDQFYFTIFGEPKWSRLISTIKSSILELTRLRDFFHLKRSRFENKLRNLSAATSLLETTQAKEQTVIANSVALQIGTLTQITVYFAFPLLFTTALFGMNFLKPSYPWAWFSGVLAGIFIANALLVSASHLLQRARGGKV